MKNWTGYFIELIIVILGVSIAFWLNQIAEGKKETETQKRYLREIQSDLSNDIARLNDVIEFNKLKIDRTFDAVKLFQDAEKNKDRIVETAIGIGNYDFFEPTDFTYKSMIASGDFKLISDYELKRNVMQLYSKYDFIDLLQNNYIQALDEGFFPFVLANFDYSTFQPTNDQMYNSLTVKNFLMYTVNDITQHVKGYKSALYSANKVDSLINVQLK